MKPNPYQSHSEQTPSVVGGRDVAGWGIRLGVAYPILILGVFHLFYCFAWFSLGHPPRPSLDDPKNISAFLSVCYLLPSLMLVVSPAVLVGTVGIEIARGGLACFDGARLLRLVFVFMIWVIAFAYVRWDPLRLFDWYMD